MISALVRRKTRPLRNSRRARTKRRLRRDDESANGPAIIAFPATRRCFAAKDEPLSDPRSLVNLSPSYEFEERACSLHRSRPPRRAASRREKRGLGRMVGVGQIPCSEVANTEEVVGVPEYTNTTARELKVEEIASSVDGGGARRRDGGGQRRKRWGDRGRARATIQQERPHLPHLASE